MYLVPAPAETVQRAGCRTATLTPTCNEPRATLRSDRSGPDFAIFGHAKPPLRNSAAPRETLPVGIFRHLPEMIAAAGCPCLGHQRPPRRHRLRHGEDRMASESSRRAEGGAGAGRAWRGAPRRIGDDQVANAKGPAPHSLCMVRMRVEAIDRGEEMQDWHEMRRRARRMASEARERCEKPPRGVTVVQAARSSRPWVGEVLHVDEVLRVACVQHCESYRWQ